MATWLAVRAEDPETVVRTLGMRTVLPANWMSGLADVAEEGVFATPSVGGWVLVVGRDLAVKTGDPSTVEELLTPLSAEFGTAQWFSTDEVRDVHGWAFAERGQMRRAYAYDGDSGHTLWQGEVTAAEHELECFRDDPRDQSDDEIKWWPDRRIVLAIARSWSLDPTKLGDGSHQIGPAAGWVGRI